MKLIYCKDVENKNSVGSVLPPVVHQRVKVTCTEIEGSGVLRQKHKQCTKKQCSSWQCTKCSWNGGEG